MLPSNGALTAASGLPTLQARQSEAMAVQLLALQQHSDPAPPPVSASVALVASSKDEEKGAVTTRTVQSVKVCWVVVRIRAVVLG